MIFTLGACSYDMKENFGDDASTRIDKALKEAKEVLQSAPNGWIVYYYADTYYGGYNMVMKFTNDTVDAMSEISAPVGQKSHYRLEQSAGVVLSFDEYNDVIHYFSDPINPGGVGDAGYGYEGDHEWRIIECSSEKIVCSGKKSNSRIELVPLPEEYTPESYFVALKKVITQMSASNVFTTVELDTITTTKSASYNSFNFVLPQENGQTVTYTRPFIFTLDGIVLYNPLEYNGHTITGFKYEGGQAKFNDFDDSDVTLHLVIKPLNEQLVTAQWYVANAEDFGAANTAFYRPFIQSLWTGEKENCQYVFIGAYSGGATTKLHFCYYSGNYPCVGSTSYEYIGDDAISTGSFSLATVSGNNNWNWYNQYYNNCIAQMSTVFANKTFDLETDLLQNPSYIILKDRSDASNVITVRSGSRQYPFGTNN